jgi:hypothetical protein
MDGRPVKVGVYNRHWATVGGGEKYGGGIAQALQAAHDVELLSHEPLDVAWFSERLSLDLRDTKLSVIGNASAAATAASAGYDLFVNTSYLSNDPSAAKTGIYVVHFPSPLVPPSPPLYRLMHPLRRQTIASSAVECGTGFYPANSGLLHSMMWTNGEGELFVDKSPTRPTTLLLSFNRSRPAQLGTTQITIDVDGVPQHELVLEPTSSRFWRPARAAISIPQGQGEPSRVVIRSATFVPEETLGSDDSRRLGVALSLVATRPRHLGPRKRPRTFVDSYSKVVANA